MVIHSSVSRTLIAATIVVAVSLAGSSGAAQSVTSAFASAYTVIELGTVPGVPTRYGGLTFIDNDTILIGGAANGSTGRLYSIDVTRDVGGHITGFTGTAVQYGQVGDYNDGGVAFGPGGVLFTAQWPVRRLGQTRPGSTDEDKVIDLAAAPLSLPAGPGGLTFVPAGMPGAGQLKVVAYDDYKWYTFALAPDGSGTYNVTSATLQVTLQGGPEGIAYVPPGSPLFPNPSVLVSEYQSSLVGVYEVDGNGDPVKASRQTFITGLSGAEGAVIDPVTGDFLFSTFGSVNKVIRVSGFAVPNPPIQITGTVRDPGGLPLAAVTLALTGTRLGHDHDCR